MALMVVGVVSFGFFWLSCASLHQVSKVSGTPLSKVLLSTGIQEKKINSAEFSCIDYFSFFSEQWTDLRVDQNLDCLNEIKSGSATYGYEFEPSPHLQFLSSDPSAQCMQNLFPQLRLPQEIYFLARPEPFAPTGTNPKAWDCYAINLNVEAGVVADVKLPWDRFKLKLNFPVYRHLKGRADLQIWLMVTLFEAMRSEMGGVLKGSIVPEAQCLQCYQNTPGFEEKRAGKIPLMVWP